MVGAVLAGGRSARMGVDKARLPLRGVPMAEAVARVLEAGGCTRVFLVRRGPPDGLPWTREVVREGSDRPRHVLTGMATALRAADGPVLVAACDLVDLAPDRVRALLAAPGAVAWDERPAALAHLLPANRGGIEAAAAAGASFTAWAAERPRVEARGELRNVNRWEELGEPHPIQVLLDRLGLSGAAAVRAEVGERARLAAIGCVLPELPPLR